jgi:hypothetical protein
MHNAASHVGKCDAEICVIVAQYSNLREHRLTIAKCNLNRAQPPYFTSSISSFQQAKTQNEFMRRNQSSFSTPEREDARR